MFNKWIKILIMEKLLLMLNIFTCINVYYLLTDLFMQKKPNFFLL
jgi:hypothetical protein